MSTWTQVLAGGQVLAGDLIELEGMLGWLERVGVSLDRVRNNRYQLCLH